MIQQESSQRPSKFAPAMRRNFAFLCLALLLCGLQAQLGESHQWDQLYPTSPSGDWGRLEHPVPRLKSDSTWLTPGGKFSIGQIHLGMPHSQVKRIYPVESTSAHDPKQFFYGDFRRSVEVRYDQQDRVARVRAAYLEQGGRPLFNERSRRSDVERTFPTARWDSESQDQLRLGIPSGFVVLRNGSSPELDPGLSCVLESTLGEGDW